MSALNNHGIGSVINYINHTPFKHVYLIGMTNCRSDANDYSNDINHNNLIVL